MEASKCTRKASLRKFIEETQLPGEPPASDTPPQHLEQKTQLREGTAWQGPSHSTATTPELSCSTQLGSSVFQVIEGSAKPLVRQISPPNHTLIGSWILQPELLSCISWVSHKGLDLEAMTQSRSHQTPRLCLSVQQPGKATLGAAPKVPGLAGFPAWWLRMSGCVPDCLPKRAAAPGLGEPKAAWGGPPQPGPNSALSYGALSGRIRQRRAKLPAVPPSPSLHFSISPSLIFLRRKELIGILVMYSYIMLGT